MVWPSAIAAGGAIGGAALGANSAKRNNEAMIDYQKHRYQYTTADLKAAGLNPILAVKGMSPGNSPQLQQSQAGPALANGLNSAASLLTQGYNAKTQRSTQQQQGQLIDQQIQTQHVQNANSAADTLNKVEQAKQIAAQTRLLNEQALSAPVQRALMSNQGANYSANTAKTQYDTVESRKKAEFYNTDTGRGAIEDNITNKAGPIIGLTDTISNWWNHATNNSPPHSAKKVNEQSKLKPNSYQSGLINQYKKK